MGTFLTGSLSLLLVAVCIGLSAGKNVKGVTKDPALLGASWLEPAPGFECPANGVFPHATDCLLYYECWEGAAQLWTCTDIMLFDLVYDGCNYASAVYCGERERPPGFPPTVTPPVEVTHRPPPPDNFTCTVNGAFPHPDYCEYYYLCYEGEKQFLRCSGQQLYDLRYNGCNFPELTYCGDRSRPPGVPPTITPPPGTTPTTVRTTTTTDAPVDCPYPHPRNCEYYYECNDNGAPLLTKCPADWLYDLRLRECNVPRDVDCGDRIRPPDYPGTVTPPPSSTLGTTTTTQEPPPETTVEISPSTVRTTTEGTGFVCPAASGNFADPADCAWFYACDNWIIVGHQRCPDPLYFNPLISNCDFPWNVDCPNRHK